LNGVNRLLAGLCFVLSVSLLGGSIAQSGAGFIHVDEIRPGMKGYGLSVLRGTEPERFDVEVIDVLHNFRPNQDLILIRTPHPLLDRARGVAGMSGSPIYLDGRLAGAYAYGWSYGTDPVVGVTPIANMLAELRRPVNLEMFPGAMPLPSQPRAESTRRPPSKERLAGLPPYEGEHRVDVELVHEVLVAIVPELLLVHLRDVGDDRSDVALKLSGHASLLRFPRPKTPRAPGMTGPQKPARGQSRGAAA